MLRNVLLVDDNSVSNFLSRRTLEVMRVANEIHVATNGEEALNLFNDYFQGTKHPPDVILLDLNMPVMDGFTFLEAFQRLTLPQKNHVKIIVVSTSFHKKDIARALLLGAHHYLTKPLNAETLLAALDGTSERILPIRN